MSTRHIVDIMNCMNHGLKKSYTFQAWRKSVSLIFNVIYTLKANIMDGQHEKI